MCLVCWGAYWRQAGAESGASWSQAGVRFGVKQWNQQTGSEVTCLQWAEEGTETSWLLLEEKTGEECLMILMECMSQIPQLLNWQWESGIPKKCSLHFEQVKGSHHVHQMKMKTL